MNWKNRRGFGLLETILAVGVLAVMIGGAFYYSSKTFELPSNLERVSSSTNPVGIAKDVMNQAKENVTPQQDAINQLSGQSLVINTSTWKTYRNDKYGFEFMYPKEWSDESPDSWKYIKFIKTVDAPYGDISGSSFSVGIYDQSFQALFNSGGYCPRVAVDKSTESVKDTYCITKEKIVLDSGVWTQAESCSYKLCTSPFFIIHKDIIYGVDLPGYDDGGVFMRVFSTFKFTK